VNVQVPRLVDEIPLVCLLIVDTMETDALLIGSHIDRRECVQAPSREARRATMQLAGSLFCTFHALIVVTNSRRHYSSSSFCTRLGVIACFTTFGPARVSRSAAMMKLTDHAHATLEECRNGMTARGNIHAHGEDSSRAYYAGDWDQRVPVATVNDD
jgi:sulfur relay (sulfurtransferase) complex TusBCD TusD component (DsrE family)